MNYSLLGEKIEKKFERENLKKNTIASASKGNHAF